MEKYLWPLSSRGGGKALVAGTLKKDLFAAYLRLYMFGTGWRGQFEILYPAPLIHFGCSELDPLNHL